MGAIGKGLGVFESQAKSVSMQPLYSAMSNIASSMMKSKAEAAKQQRAAEERAMAKLDDFVISDKNNYTQKQLPVAKGAMQDLINKVSEDKTKYPNTWMNMISGRILNAKDKLNQALEQSNIQRDIEKKIDEGYMAPPGMKDMFRNNPGDMSDYIKNKGFLARFGVSVTDDGQLSGTLSQPVDIEKSFRELKSNDDLFKTGTPAYTDKKGYNVLSIPMTMDQTVKDQWIDKWANDKGAQQMYLAQDDKFKMVVAKVDQIITANPSINKEEALLQGVRETIREDLGTKSFDRTKEQFWKDPAGKSSSTQAGIITLPEATYYNDNAPNGKKAMGVNFMDLNQKTNATQKPSNILFPAKTEIYGADLSTAKVGVLTSGQLASLSKWNVTNVFKVEGDTDVVWVQMDAPLPVQGTQNLAISGLNSGWVKLVKGSSLDTFMSARMGKNAYNYVSGLRGSGNSAAQPSRARTTIQNTSAPR